MLFDEFSFHDSQILEVKENCLDQTVDFSLDFPVSWEDNKFEKRLLRFRDVVVYIKKEIPFSGYPTILSVEFKNTSKHSFNNSLTNVVTSRYKIEMTTNAGSRFIEFSDAELLTI